MPNPLPKLFMEAFRRYGKPMQEDLEVSDGGGRRDDDEEFFAADPDILNHKRRLVDLEKSMSRMKALRRSERQASEKPGQEDAAWKEHEAMPEWSSFLAGKYKLND